MKLQQKTIEESIKLAKENQYFNKLKEEYEKIDGGKCAGCTNCCAESVHTYYVEFLNVYNYLKNHKEIYDLLIPKIEKYYLEELYKNNKCPFLNEEGKCYIYNVRPLVCRLFGHFTKNEHESNYEKVLQTNKQISQYINEEYDLKIPSKVINKKVPYCENFSSENKLTKEDRLNIQDNLLGLDSKYFIMEIIDENHMNLGLVDWFILLIHGEEYFYKKIEKAKDNI